MSDGSTQDDAVAQSVIPYVTLQQRVAVLEVAQISNKHLGSVANILANETRSLRDDLVEERERLSAFKHEIEDLKETIARVEVLLPKMRAPERRLLRSALRAVRR